MSKITVLKVNKTKAEKGYTIVELAYKTEDGKTKGMKIFPFGDQKEVAEVAGEAKQGDVLEATFRQNQKGFWEFGSLKATGESSAQTAETGSKAGQSRGAGNWETSEERAAKQEKISRQAVLNTAVAFYEVTKAGKPSKENIVEVANYFLDFVNNRLPVSTAPKATPSTGDVE